MSTRRRPAGWVPHQHGAWAMLLWPYGVGVVLAVVDNHFRWYAVPLFALWMVGYLAFHAASQWLKSRRAHRYRAATVTYSTAAAIVGLITWALAGWGLAWWLIAYLPLLGVALAMAASRRERDLLPGLLTVAAASLVLLVVGWANPADLIPVATPQRSAIAMTAVSFAYFGGTVWHVKTLIRQRGKPGWVAASITWHGLATALAALTAASGYLSWWWTPFFAATTVRAAVMPLRWTMRGRRITPQAAGIVEIVFTVVAAAIAFATAGR